MNAQEEILRTITDLKNASFTQILDTINEKRISKKLSPTTLNLTLKSLVQNDLVKKTKKTRKQPFYSPSKYSNFELAIEDIRKTLDQVSSEIKQRVERVEKTAKTFGELVPMLDKLGEEYFLPIDLVEKITDLFFLFEPHPPIAIGVMEQKDAKKRAVLIPITKEALRHAYKIRKKKRS